MFDFPPIFMFLAKLEYIKVLNNFVISSFWLNIQIQKFVHTDRFWRRHLTIVYIYIYSFSIVISTWVKLIPYWTHHITSTRGLLITYFFFKPLTHTRRNLRICNYPICDYMRLCVVCNYFWNCLPISPNLGKVCDFTMTNVWLLSSSSSYMNILRIIFIHK